LKPTQANLSRPSLEKHPSQKKAGGVAQSIGPEFKPQYHTKRRKILCSERQYIIASWSAVPLSSSNITTNKF
jgi:hypothetical protein